jgi:two-component system response regulator WspF
MAPIRVGIVNDLALATTVLERIVSSDTAMHVVWKAVDGAQAIELCRRDRPDIVLMDLIMPNVDGVAATRRIMADTPCPILVVTSTVSGNMDRVYDAMGAGALDAVATPKGLGPEGEQDSRALLRKIHSIHALHGRRAPAPLSAPRAASSITPIIAIGASTGGPAAIETILGQLPADLPAAVVIVQHIDADFVGGFVRWLAGRTPLAVRLAADDEAPTAGTVLVADSRAHLSLGAAGRLRYVDVPGALYQPSVDVFFHALARYGPRTSTGVLLTGLGRDGAAGLLALREAGYETIAQDRETAVVFGMPGAAVALGAAKQIRPIGRIADHLLLLHPVRKAT